MMEFEDIQGLWQSQETPQGLDEATMKVVRQFERKVRRDKFMLWVTLPLTCAFILILAFWYGDPLYAVGIGINILAMVLFLFHFRKIKAPGKAHAPEEATGDFLRHNLSVLWDYKRMARRITPVYGGLLVLGQVVSFASFLKDQEIWTQVGICLAYALGLSLFFLFTYYLYMRKWNRKWKPLMEKLEQELGEFS